MERILILSLFILVGACSPSSEKVTLAPDGLGLTTQTTLRTLEILDRAGKPVAGARIMLGLGTADLAGPDLIVSDANGQLTLPKTWQAHEPITVDAPGFVRATYWGLPDTQNTLLLNPTDGEQKIQLSGITSGYETLKKDGWMDFGLVMAHLKREEVFAFDMSLVLSPEVDRISVPGQDMSIPSNLSIPRQTETYIFPLTFDKPLYRIFFRDQGAYRVGATHGRFPFKTVVSHLREGKTFYDVINHFQFKSASYRDVLVLGDAKLDLALKDRFFDTTVSIQAPSFPADLGMIVVALAENEGYLQATDIKNFTSKQTLALTVPSRQLLRFLSVLQPKDAQKLNTGHEMSVAYTEQAGALPEFIPLSAAPRYNSDVVSLSPPAAPVQIRQAGTYLALSDIESIDNGDYRYERKFRKWEFYINHWPKQVTLPLFPEPVQQKYRLRWETNFLGQANVIRTSHLGPQMLERASHASRNILDL